MDAGPIDRPEEACGRYHPRWQTRLDLGDEHAGRGRCRGEDPDSLTDRAALGCRTERVPRGLASS